MAITVQERDQVLKIVAGLFNGAPGGAYLSDFSAAVEAGMTLSELARALAATNEFKQDIMGGKVTVEQQVAVLMNHFGVVADNVEGSAASQAHAFFTDSVNAKVDFGDIVYTAVVFLENDTSAEFAPFRDMLNNKAAVAVAHAENSTTIASVAAGQVILAGVTSEGPSTPEEIAEHLAGVSGGTSTFVLTTSADTVTGTAGNDTINGNTADTWTGFDAIDGGAGTDTMNVLLTGMAVPGASTITGVENLNINTSGAGFAIDTTSYTGLTAVKVASSAAGVISVTGATTTAASVVGTGVSAVDVIGTGGALSITTGAAAVKVGQTAAVNALTSATVVGGTTVEISDNKTTAQADGTTLTTVSLKGNTGAATLNTDGLTTLALTNNTQNATVSAIAGTRALTLNLDGATGGTIADAEATTLNVNATGTKSSGVTLNAAKATTVAVDSVVDLTVADVNIAAATGLTIAGEGKTTISATSTVTALTSIDASANTGGAIITPALGTGVAFTGGTGADTVSIAAAGTKTIAMGGGDDTVTYGGALGTGGSIDGGEGTDTIAMTAAAAVTATGSTTFAGTVSGFEVLELNAATGAAAAINLANADGINSLTINGATVGALTVTGAAAGFTLTQKALTSFASSVALASDVGTNDTVNLAFKANDGFTNTAAFTIANVENLVITTADTDTVAQTAQFVAPITAAAAVNVTVSGDTGVNLTGLTATTITNLDASGLTSTVAAAGGLTWTAGALAAAATISGSAAATNTVDFSAATKAVTYTGGTGNDAITANVTGDVATITLGDGVNSVAGGTATKALTVTGGAGVDTITTGDGADVITAGAGNDIISSGKGLDQLTGGAGNDTFNIVANTNGNIFATITDAAAGDILSFADSTGFNATQVTLGGTAVFQDFLNEAAKGDESENLSWFQFGGNTYVVEDVNAESSFVNNVDEVVKLAGVIDLSTATFAGDALTIA